MTIRFLTIAAIILSGSTLQAQDGGMSFFLTSANLGNGGDFGGIAGADAHCTDLAEAAGTSGKTWRAYLSTSTENARDRIGSGPWVNANGEIIAEGIDALHNENSINKQTALNESGAPVNGRGDTPNQHDILTGSTPEGKVAEGMTCEDWTSSDADSSAMVGHHDRMGLDDSPPSKSWNSSHSSRGGCGIEALRGTGGEGLLYCFATN